MRKQSLLHLHELVHLIHSKLRKEGCLDPDQHRRHKDAPTRPSSVHTPKETHKQAVTLYLEDITKALEGDVIANSSSEPMQ